MWTSIILILVSALFIAYFVQVERTNKLTLSRNNWMSFWNGWASGLWSLNIIFNIVLLIRRFV